MIRGEVGSMHKVGQRSQGAGAQNLFSHLLEENNFPWKYKQPWKDYHLGLIGIALVFQIRLMEILILFGKNNCCFQHFPSHHWSLLQRPVQKRRLLSSKRPHGPDFPMLWSQASRHTVGVSILLYTSLNVTYSSKPLPLFPLELMTCHQ